MPAPDAPSGLTMTEADGQRKLDNMSGSPALGNDKQQLTIPDFEIESLARILLPKIQTYFASPEGQAAFAEWKRQQQKQ